MASAERSSEDRAAKNFAEQAAGKSSGLVREFYDFLRYNKKWWLAPIIIVLFLLIALVLLSGTAAMPFIYPLF